MTGLLIFLTGSAAKTAGVVGFALFLVSYTVLAERRFSAMIQDRLGPNRIGIPFTNIRLQGLGQPIADALKLLLKEEFTPAHVHKFYFYLAPILGVVPPLIVLGVIPFGSAIDLRPVAGWVGNFFNAPAEITNAFYFDAVVADLNVGILFVFAVVSLGVYGLILAGWSSNSKYSFLGGVRASAQLISYELLMGLAVVPVFLVVSELSFTRIVDFQIQNGWFIFPWKLSPLLWPPFFFAFVLFLISAFAETNRLPFDLPECESELVSGYHTEYSSMKFALFFLGEYTAMIAVSAVMVTVFLGGWSLPLPWLNNQPVPVDWPVLAGMAVPWWFGWVHIGVFVAKVIALLILFIWVRWTLPRFRYDQLMGFCWKYLIPLGFLNLLWTAWVFMMTT